MDKDKFISLKIDDKINYLNDQLNNGLGVKDIREKLGIGEKALQRIIKNSDILYLVVIKVFENHNLSIVDC